MKYNIQILPPRGSLKKFPVCVIQVTTYDTDIKGFVASVDPATQWDYPFEMPDEVPWCYHSMVFDGPRFTTELIYTTKKGKKTEIVRPVVQILI